MAIYETCSDRAHLVDQTHTSPHRRATRRLHGHRLARHARQREDLSGARETGSKAALAEHGYVYARSAASLRTSKTHTVGVILNNVSDPFFSALLASLEEALAQTGRTVFLCNTNESCERQADFIRTMAEYNADGIIVSPAIGSYGKRIFRRSTSPFRRSYSCRGQCSIQTFDFVINDDYEAGRLATERLLTLGHRRIAVVGGDPSASPFGERMRGHRAALERAHVAFDGSLVWTSVPTRLEGFQGGALDYRARAPADGRDLLQRFDRPRAVPWLGEGRPLPRKELRAHRP